MALKELFPEDCSIGNVGIQGTQEEAFNITTGHCFSCKPQDTLFSALFSSQPPTFLGLSSAQIGLRSREALQTSTLQGWLT